MRVLLDENVDRKLKPYFDPAFTVVAVPEQGWAGKKNGDLLRAASAAFDVLVTLDRHMQHQQRLAAYDLAVVLIAARSTRRQDILPAMPEVNARIHTATAGRLYVVIP
jgi:predicted nuclease of predicted toxin-antitoxin system